MNSCSREHEELNDPLEQLTLILAASFRGDVENKLLMSDVTGRSSRADFANAPRMIAVCRAPKSSSVEQIASVIQRGTAGTLRGSAAAGTGNTFAEDISDRLSHCLWLTTRDLNGKRPKRARGPARPVH